VINALCALLAQRAGHHALYLSGAGVANASYGQPDLGLTSLDDVLIDVRRITAITELPLLVDVDTGWEESAGVAATVQQLIQAGAAGMHIEDQDARKRCGHRDGKVVVEIEWMIKRLRAAIEARSDGQFVIMARTDAVAVEGLDRTIDRVRQYVAAGADMIFVEALETLDQYRQFTEAIRVPVLANITEFGKTPLFSADELADAGISIVLYPLSAFRAMNAAAATVFAEILNEGTQRGVVDMMQTRSQLYDLLDYKRQEELVDRELENPV
jgi:methylisocitrate lyase